MEVLCFLVRNRDRIVREEELRKTLWGETDKTSVPQCIKSIRTALRDTRKRLVATIPKLGYQFTCEVHELPKASIRVDNLPRPNPHFRGRSKILQNLGNTFASGSSVQALCGLPGIGKTEVAIEYARRHAEAYSVIWRINAEYDAEISSSLADLARELYPEKALREHELAAREALRWLDRNSNWLLIFDNAVEPKSLRGHLPRHDRGHVLITSRNPTPWQEIATVVLMPCFTLREAADYLSGRTHETHAATKSTARSLGYHPLALHAAAAYCEATKRSLAEYLSLFESKTRRLLWKGGEHKVVFTTFSVAIADCAAKSAEAIPLLRLLAHLDPDGVPCEIFRYSNFLGSSLNNLATREDALDRVLVILQEYGVVQIMRILRARYGDSRTVHMHRLFGLVIRDSLSEKERRLYSTKAVRLVNAVLDRQGRGVNWVEPLRFLHHALATLRSAEEIGRVRIAHKYCVLLFEAIRYDVNGNSREAAKICEEILNQLADGDGPYPTVAINLATFYEHDGQPENALKILQDLLSNAGNLRPSVYWWAKYQMGIMLEVIGDFSSAVAIFEDIRNQDAAESPHKIGALYRLGRIALRHHDLGKAEAYFKQCLKERGNDGKNYRRAYELHGLGQVYAQRRIWRQAHQYYKEAIEITERYGYQRYLNEIRITAQRYPKLKNLLKGFQGQT